MPLVGWFETPLKVPGSIAKRSANNQAQAVPNKV
jgi:hypothetical protein